MLHQRYNLLLIIAKEKYSKILVIGSKIQYLKLIKKIIFFDILNFLKKKTNNKHVVNI